MICFFLNFPDYPPAIQIINTDPQTLTVHAALQQDYDEAQKFINLKVSSMNSWSTHKNLVRVLQEAQNLLSQKFPYF